MSIVQEKSCCRCGSGTQRKIEEKVDEEKAAKGKTDQPPLLKPDMDDEDDEDDRSNRKCYNLSCTCFKGDPDNNIPGVPCTNCKAGAFCNNTLTKREKKRGKEKK